MAEQESANLFLPVLLSLGSGSEPDYYDMNDADFFIGRRSSITGSESNTEFSRARLLNPNGSRILDLESEADSDEQIIAIGDDPITNIQIQIQESTDLNYSLYWDCLRIDEDRNEEFEWEEIDGGLNQEQEQESDRNVEWEVLLTNQLENHDDAESFVDEGFVYANSEYDEVIFSQFEEHHHSLLNGSSPASKLVVENLPSIDFTKNGNIIITCAICNDEILMEEKGKKLPCSHCYHGRCILPWLEMRNTCPLCRFELPIDDPEVENERVSWSVKFLFTHAARITFTPLEALWIWTGSIKLWRLPLLEIDLCIFSRGENE